MFPSLKILSDESMKVWLKKKGGKQLLQQYEKKGEKLESHQSYKAERYLQNTKIHLNPNPAWNKALPTLSWTSAMLWISSTGAQVIPSFLAQCLLHGSTELQDLIPPQNTQENKAAESQKVPQPLGQWQNHC